MDTNIVFEYTLDQAVADGVLVKAFENRWPQLTGGRPLVVTAAIANEFSQAAWIEIWNEYAEWRRNTMPSLPEEDQMFTTKMNNKTVWLIDDGYVFTILFPEDY
jgi:hypothetical protein